MILIASALRIPVVSNAEKKYNSIHFDATENAVTAADCELRIDVMQYQNPINKKRNLFHKF